MASPYSSGYSLYQRNGIYWVAFQCNRSRIRKSLRIRDKRIAEARADALYKAHVGAQGYGESPQKIDQHSWMRHVAEAIPGDNSWLSKLYASCSSRARFKKIPFSLTFIQLKEIATSCGGHCMVTYTPLVPYPPMKARVHPFQPSIDRISSTKGYTFDNCRIVCYAANLAMNTWGSGPLKAMMMNMAGVLASNFKPQT